MPVKFAWLFTALILSGPQAAMAPVCALFLARLAPAFSAKQAMNVALDDLDGSPHILADWHGKVLVVNFWATWCPPYRQEIPLLVKLQAKYAAQDLQVVGIAMISTGGDSGIGVGFTIWATGYPRHRITTCP